MKTTLVIVALLLTACPPKPPPVPPIGTATCREVCAHYADLQCEAAQPTNEGATCEAVCANVQASVVVHWDLDCRVRAGSCTEVDACERKK